MNNKIMVRELPNILSTILAIFLAIGIAGLSLIVALKLSDIFPDIPIGFGILIFFVVLCCPFIIFLLIWFYITRKKIAVTPILHVDEKIPISKEQKAILDNVEGAERLQELKEFVSGSGSLLTGLTKTVMLAAAKKGTHIKYSLCEERIILYGGPFSNLFRWKRIRKLTADPKNKQFEFTARGILAQYTSYAPNTFEETKQVLSKYIVVG